MMGSDDSVALIYYIEDVPFPDLRKRPGETRRESEARHEQFWGSKVMHREHRYVGGPPPPRIKRMQLAHETRARRLGLAWDIIDLRTVYRHHNGICGICREPVGVDEFTIDHIVPVSKRGPHLFHNLQPAHRACNSRKGNN